MAHYKKGRHGHPTRKRLHRTVDGISGWAKRRQAKRSAGKSGRRGRRSMLRTIGYKK